ncbi:TolC family protein [Sediminibacterium ginsengisoli]|uniref:Outer membrane protein TolC n=1 Tax=Sediminibacterium ginsengisoli TaxID=413434 RepID=A0A1T4JZ73_9BACT|nr:TolC family protein [Sediminibacterium ginsengisoli]SJZ35461.1 Outer membrane protein TolC [Sediminibacterium ginsengisoli]
MMNLWTRGRSHLIMSAVSLLCFTAATKAQSPSLLLQDAIRTGLTNYQSLKAKKDYLNASSALAVNVKNDYLPNVIAGLQQNYGTINGQFGPMAPAGILGVSSAGPASDKQSWAAAFGSLYIINTNWEAFTFGRRQSRIDAASAQVRKDSADLLQEEFIQSIRISGAYLNLLIAQRLILNAQSNLERATTVKNAVLARTLSGLNAGVDSSIANAEVSRARLALIDANNNEQQLRNILIQQMNIAPETLFLLDSSFFKKIPVSFTNTGDIEQNPQVQYYASRVAQSTKQEEAIRKSILPGINLFGIFQARGSGFDYNYAPGFTDRYSKSYFEGIKPARANYVAGFSVSWNIISPTKIKQQVVAQQFITKAYRDEYDLVQSQLKAQLSFADQRIENSLRSFHEVPNQYKSATDAYIQKSVLYKNGLTTIIDLQQALYAVNKAETDVSVAYINVWQALLQKAAASGDLDLFLKQVK